MNMSENLEISNNLQNYFKETHTCKDTIYTISTDIYKESTNHVLYSQTQLGRPRHAKEKVQ